VARNNIILICALFCIQFLYAEAPYRYLVYLKDKPQAFDPASLFTKSALEKRARYNIPFDDRDKPVDPAYIEQLKNLNASVIYQSNWLNAVLIQANEENIEQIKTMPGVLKIQRAGGGNVKKSNKSKYSGTQSAEDCEDVADIEDYEDNFTSSFAQFHLLNGEYLHEQGFNGEGMTVAVCDNGFYNANTNPGFSHVFSENRLLGTYDYVHGDSAVYDESSGSHGSNCFSFIGGLKTNQYIGTATRSSFYLFHTEDNSGERLQEEFNLALALERCSQVGVDVVTISLGYFTFQVPSENHDTTDMHSNNTPAAIAANIASSKGILVFAAAGNSNDGIYITTPSDADSAVCVAAVDINGNIASFSSHGLPGDPRIKPNVAAMGVSASYLTPSGNVNMGNGTSYATPSLAGMATCLWQAFPSKTNWEIKTAIEQSASQYLTPDKRVGYGIPDFKKAYQLLSTPTFVSNPVIENDYSIFPNPFENSITITNSGQSTIQSVQLYNSIGQMVYSDQSFSSNSITLDGLSIGMYLVQLTTSQGILIKKIIKD
jgi:subtilisin family serine protease